MEHRKGKKTITASRIGFQYFSDTKHYRQSDLEDWLPVLENMGVEWLLLKSSTKRAIPEYFISNLVQKNLNLIIDFSHSQKNTLSWQDLSLLIEQYGKWGIKYALLDKDPNVKTSWRKRDWIAPQLVENHSRQFIQFADICLQHNIIPLYSPLYPGGDYWDHSFFTSAMKTIRDYSSGNLLNNFNICVYAWHYGKTLDVDSEQSNYKVSNKIIHPAKNTPTNVQFRNYENIHSIAKKILGKRIPIILLDCGVHSRNKNGEINNSDENIEIQKSIFKLLSSKNVYNNQLEQLIDGLGVEIAAGVFTQLASDEPNPLSWFVNANTPALVAQSIFTEKTLLNPVKNNSNLNGKKQKNFKFNRYILLHERYKPEIDQFIRGMYQYISKYKPIIGFSKEEAASSAYVVYICPTKTISDEDKQWFKTNGGLLKIIQPKDIRSLVE